jgi:hypothetical protein
MYYEVIFGGREGRREGEEVKIFLWLCDGVYLLPWPLFTG